MLEEVPPWRAQLTAMLVQARQDATAARLDAAVAPRTLGEAALVQRDVMRCLQHEVAAWKVGRAQKIRPQSVVAPVLLRDDKSRESSFPIVAEIEIFVTLGNDLPPLTNANYTLDQIVESIDGIGCGVEFVSERVDPRHDPTGLISLADCLSNIEYLAGDMTADAAILSRDFFSCKVIIEGTDSVVSLAMNCFHPLGNPLTPIVEYANNQFDMLGGLRSGHIVTTGNLCLVRIEGPARITASIGGVGDVSFSVSDVIKSAGAR